MVGKVQAKRDVLRAKLIELASERIVADGAGALKARDLASGAGCSVGAIYNLFEDLNDLVMVVNLQTFQRMGAFVSREVEASGQKDPLEQLIVMGHAYLEFASENSGIWRSLFDVASPDSKEAPDWYWEEMAKIFALIELPLSELHADQKPEEIKVLTRILFSSVHGTILLGLEGSLFAVPMDGLRLMVEMLIRRFAK